MLLILAIPKFIIHYSIQPRHKVTLVGFYDTKSLGLYEESIDK
jgi:hypothetical protein